MPMFGSNFSHASRVIASASLSSEEDYNSRFIIPFLKILSICVSSSGEVYCAYIDKSDIRLCSIGPREVTEINVASYNLGHVISLVMGPKDELFVGDHGKGFILKIVGNQISIAAGNPDRMRYPNLDAIESFSSFTVSSSGNIIVGRLDDISIVNPGNQRIFGISNMGLANPNTIPIRVGHVSAYGDSILFTSINHIYKTDLVNGGYTLYSIAGTDIYPDKPLFDSNALRKLFSIGLALFVSQMGEIYHIERFGEKPRLIRISRDGMARYILGNHKEYNESIDYNGITSVAVNSFGTIYLAERDKIHKIEGSHIRTMKTRRIHKDGHVVWDAPTMHTLNTLTPKFYAIVQNCLKREDDNYGDAGSIAMIRDLVSFIAHGAKAPYLPRCDPMAVLIFIQVLNEPFLGPLKLIMMDRFRQYLTDLQKRENGLSLSNINHYINTSGLYSLDEEDPLRVWVNECIRYQFDSNKNGPLPVYSDRESLHNAQVLMSQRNYYREWIPEPTESDKCYSVFSKKKLFSQSKNSYWRLFENPIDHDVELAFGGQVFKCHESIISSSRVLNKLIVHEREQSSNKTKPYNNTLKVHIVKREIVRIEPMDDNVFEELDTIQEMTSNLEMECLIGYCYGVLDLSALDKKELRRFYKCLSRYQVDSFIDELVDKLLLEKNNYIVLMNNYFGIDNEIDELIGKYMRYCQNDMSINDLMSKLDPGVIGPFINQLSINMQIFSDDSTGGWELLRSKRDAMEHDEEDFI